MATVYLAPSPTGDDTRTYAAAQNSATPWATFAKVQSGATSTDTINVAAGTYTQTASITFTKSFTFVGPPPVSGMPVAVVDFNGTNYRWINNTDSKTMSFSNMRFIGQTATTNNESMMWFGSGVAFTLIISNCVFNNIVVYGDGSSNNSGIIMVGSAGTGSVTITNSLFYNITKAAAAGGGTILDIWGTQTSSLTGCVVSHTGSGTSLLTQFFRNHAGGNSTVHKNGIYKTTTATSIGTSQTYSYTCGYNFTSAPTGTGVITSDPLIIDDVGANFHISQSSPCIGTGITP